MTGTILQVPTLGPIIKRGLSPAASDDLRHILPTNELWRVGQTIGDAAASAGTHAQDGIINGKPYGGAVDLHIEDLSARSRLDLLYHLGLRNLVAWLRVPGSDHWPSADALHIHAVCVEVPLKYSLRHQIHDAIHDRNGLASHALYKTWHRPEAVKARNWAMFVQFNPADN